MTGRIARQREPGTIERRAGREAGAREGVVWRGGGVTSRGGRRTNPGRAFHSCQPVAFPAARPGGRHIARGRVVAAAACVCLYRRYAVSARFRPSVGADSRRLRDVTVCAGARVRVTGTVTRARQTRAGRVTVKSRQQTVRAVQPSVFLADSRGGGNSRVLSR